MKKPIFLRPTQDWCRWITSRLTITKESPVISGCPPFFAFFVQRPGQAVSMEIASVLGGFGDKNAIEPLAEILRDQHELRDTVSAVLDAITKLKTND